LDRFVRRSLLKGKEKKQKKGQGDWGELKGKKKRRLRKRYRWWAGDRGKKWIELQRELQGEGEIHRPGRNSPLGGGEEQNKTQGTQKKRDKFRSVKNQKKVARRMGYSKKVGVKFKQGEPAVVHIKRN